MAGNGVNNDVELELRSEDGEIFKVKAFHLKSGSIVFRDMLSFPSTKPPGFLGQVDCGIPNRPENVIDIAVSPAVLRLFTALLKQDAIVSAFKPCSGNLHDGTLKHETGLCGLHNLTSIMDLLDRFDCAIGMRERALHHHLPIFCEDPWAVFVMAARANDVTHGKEALRRFPATSWSHVDPARMDTKMAHSVPFEWFMGYLRALGSQMVTAGVYGVPNFAEANAQFWIDVAESFAPHT